MRKISRVLCLGLFLLAACAYTGEASPTPAAATASPQPTATRTPLPTPSSLGDPVVWRNLQVSMDRAEITDRFTTEFGTQRIPTAGRKFLWIHIRLENAGEGEILLPVSENFSVLYAESEIKPIYGHRQGYVDYSDSGTTLFPGQELDAWLRFDIPETAALKDLWFVFLPTSAQVGALPSSASYPYAENKPTYVWKLEE